MREDRGLSVKFHCLAVSEKKNEMEELLVKTKIFVRTFCSDVPIKIDNDLMKSRSEIIIFMKEKKKNFTLNYIPIVTSCSLLIKLNLRVRFYYFTSVSQEQPRNADQ